MKGQAVAFQMIDSSDDCFHNYDSVPQLKFFYMKKSNPSNRTSLSFFFFFFHNVYNEILGYPFLYLHGPLGNVFIRF